MVFCEIASNELNVKFSPIGAEILEIKQPGKSHNWIWPAVDPWKRSAPILFPIVGKLKKDRYLWKNKEYRLSQHGFARDMKFSLIQHSAHRALFRLRESEESLEKFPFSFSLEVEYLLEGPRLRVIYLVKNHEQGPLYFNLGWHPAFALPGQAGDGALRLQGSQILKEARLLKDGLLSEELYETEADKNGLILQSQIFAQDALIFLNSGQRELSLKDSLGHEIKIFCEQAPHLGLWTKDISKFICIEPWWGFADSIDVDGNLNRKPGIQTLGPGETWSGGVTVEIGNSSESNKA